MPRICRLLCCLPFPLKNVVLIQPGFVRLPGDLPAAVWQQHLSTLPEVVAGLAIALDKRGGVGWSGLGEDYIDFEVLRWVLDVSLPLLGSSQEALADPPFDVELVYVSFALYFTPRDDDIGLVAGSVSVHWRARSTAVID